MQRVAVVVFPGSNCDADTLDAARAAGSDAYFVWHKDTNLKHADAVILPGGFSYGDYLRSGAIARFSPVLRAVAAHARAGGAVLGICNGFQILCEAGLLPGALMRNARLKFLSRPVRVRVEATDTPFTASYERGEELTLPIAHGDVPYLRGVANELNAMLAGEAAANGATFVDTYSDSIGHDFCQRTGVKWVEGLVPTSPAAPVHPNALGEEATAQQVLAAASR